MTKMKEVTDIPHFSPAEAITAIKEIVQYNVKQAVSRKSHNTFIVPILLGDPGVGKTAIPKQVAAELDIPYFQTIVAQYDAGEMAGLAFKSSVKVAEEKDGEPIMEDRMIRLRPNYLPDIADQNQHVGVYNLDELPQAFLSNQNIVSQLVNEYRIGEHQIPHGITIVCTGNKPENKAGTNPMPSHLKDRLLYMYVQPDHDGWLAHASKMGYDARVRTYIKQNPALLHAFTTGADKNPTPRSWEKTSAIMSLDVPVSIRSKLIGGQIGFGHSTTFESWLRVEDKMPNIEEILKNPEKAPLFGPEDASVLYLLLANLADRCRIPANVKPVMEYIKRIPNKEFAMYFARDAVQQNKEITKDPLFASMFMKHLVKYIV